MKILYLTHRCPYPPNKGDRIRCFNILKHLSRRYETHLVYPAFSQQDIQCSVQLREYARSVITAPINPFIAKTKCIFNILFNKAFTTSFFYSKQLARMIDSQDFDIVIADCSSMAQYVMHIDKPKIVDFVDIDSDKWRLYSENCNHLKALLYNMEYKRLSIFENQINNLFDFCLVVSEKEKALLNNESNVVVIPNGIDFEFFTPREQQNHETLIFTGAMDYFPNIDGVAYFHRNIWPLVKAHVPHARFVVAGMHPPAKIRALASDDTVVTGYVPDVRDYMAQATVCVVPLRIAKGIQNKVLEAMAMGIPVVATTAANAGINARDQQQILLAESPEEFARAVVRLLTDPHLRRAIAEHAGQFVRKHFDWEKNLSKLDGVISQLVQKT